MSLCGQDLCLLLALQVVVCKTMLVGSGRNVILPSSKVPKIQGVSCARPFICNDCSGSILKWLYLCHFFIPGSVMDCVEPS